MNIYVASSWRNSTQPDVVCLLRELNHEVYDFKEPSPGDDGFHWSAVDPAWRSGTQQQYLQALRHPGAERGFARDWDAMRRADACVLVCPCGRSAHLEAGYFVGANKPLYIYAPHTQEWELMYKMATAVLITEDELRHVFAQSSKIDFSWTPEGYATRKAVKEFAEGTDPWGDAR